MARAGGSQFPSVLERRLVRIQDIQLVSRPALQVSVLAKCFPDTGVVQITGVEPDESPTGQPAAYPAFRLRGPGGKHRLPCSKLPIGYRSNTGMNSEMKFRFGLDVASVAVKKLRGVSSSVGSK